MRRRFVSLWSLVLLGLVVSLMTVSLSSAAPPAWGQALEVPGTAVLNTYGWANTKALACSGAGTCAAGGPYTDAFGLQQAFVVDETNGAWGNAIEVPGTGTLNSGGLAVVNAVSCPAAGSCTAAGTYTDSQGLSQAFVADETNGSWGTAIEVPGTSVLAIGGAKADWVSCATAGNCVVSGNYVDAAHHLQAFVAEETSGVWGSASEVPGTATLNAGGAAEGISVACPAAGDCTVGGYYTDANARKQAFVVDATNGVWGTAIEVPSTGGLNTSGSASVRSVSCTTAGNCSIGGFYTASGLRQAFVADEINGTWGNAVEVPGTATLNSGGDARVVQVSCATAGNCGAAGYYEDTATGYQSFVVDETNGVWGTAIEVPGTGTLNTGGDSEGRSISCTGAGNCAAGGWYYDAANGREAYVVNEQGGTWQNAVGVPGSDTLNAGGDARVNVVSCGAPDSCAAGGQYNDSNWDYQAFVADSAPVGTTMLSPADATGTYGGTITLSATLTSAGNFVPNETVTFTLNGARVGSAKTDGNGVATLHDVSLAGINAGSYPNAVAASFDGDGDPAVASSGSSSLTVAKAALSIAANDRQKFYAQALTLGTTAFTPVGLVGSDSISGVTLTSAGAAGGAPSGVYSIVPSQAVAGPNTDLADNYAITYTNGTLHVTPVGIVALNTLSVKTNGGLIDSFDSSLGAYSVSNHASSALVMSNGTLTLSGVSFFGNATSTQGAVNVGSSGHVVGNVLAGTTASISGSVTGTVTKNSPSTPLTGPTVSSCAPYSSNFGITGGTFAYSAATGNLTIKKGTVTLVAGSYCFNNITFGTGATKLSVNGPVTIDLRGRITGVSGRILNPTDNPANLHIETSYVGSGGLTVPGSPHAYMTILAPKTTVSIPSGPVFGTLLASTVTLAGNAAFHADTH